MDWKAAHKAHDHFYQASGKWLICTNFAAQQEQNWSCLFNQNLGNQCLQNSSTSHLKKYLRDLYVKIPNEYFIEERKKLYFRVSDRFQMYALVELASPKNIKFVPDLVYWYSWSSFSRGTATCFSRKPPTTNTLLENRLLCCP